MPRAPLVIVNPAAGGGRAARLVPWIRERLVRRPEARIVVTSRPGDGEAVAARGAGDGHDRVVAVGGDGTVQEVLNGILAGGSASIGILPVGTGNDLARSLELPREPGEAWRVAIGRGERRIDVVRARNGAGRERWFASAGGVGFDARVAAALHARHGWRGGRAGYLVTTLAELRRLEIRETLVTMDGAAIAARALLLAFANGAYYGGGMRIAPDAVADDGQLDLCVVGEIGRLTALRQLPSLYRGTHVHHPAVTMARAAALRVETDEPAPVHLDGEPFGLTPLDLAVSSGISVAAPVRDDARRTDPAGVVDG